MALPKVDLSWMRPSDKVLNPTRGGRNAAIDTSIPSTITSRSIHHNASPRYLPSTAVGIRRPTTSLIDISHNRSGINSHAYMTPPMEPPIPEVKILVMGATGSGKSTFVNLISGSSLDVGRGLQSCTNAVQIAEAFHIDGRRVVLIDTPGFNDTTKSDTEILRTIVAFLGASYERGDMLAGVLYFHRISDLKMGGTQTRNFRMFRSLCGDNVLGNVVIVTNMWSRVEPEVGEAREAELMSEDIFFKPAIVRGARMARHGNTIPSAEAIIRLLIDNRPLPLQIQKELVDEYKDISDTTAGQELNRELNNEIRKHQEDIRILAEEMEQATKEKDEETRNELEMETKRMHEQMRRFQEEAQRLASDYWREKRDFQAHLAELERERREGCHGAEYSHHTSQWGGSHDRSPPIMPPRSSPTTEEHFTNAPGRVGERSFSRGLGDRSGVVSSAKKLYRNLRGSLQ